jgi:uncharacterized membrane protein YphA (DoxX/SURF4 family)
MAIDRHGTGLTLLRIPLGVFFLFRGLNHMRWLIAPSLLAQELAAWQHAAASGSTTAAYLGRFAIPFASVLARLLPVGEVCAGLALVAGFWTSLFAFLAFVVMLNVHVASGALFHYAFLTNAYGLPVLGGTLALAIGGVRLPWSFRS